MSKPKLTIDWLLWWCWKNFNTLIILLICTKCLMMPHPTIKKWIFKEWNHESEMDDDKYFHVNDAQGFQYLDSYKVHPPSILQVWDKYHLLLPHLLWEKIVNSKNHNKERFIHNLSVYHPELKEVHHYSQEGFEQVLCILLQDAAC